MQVILISVITWILKTLFCAQKRLNHSGLKIISFMKLGDTFLCLEGKNCYKDVFCCKFEDVVCYISEPLAAEIK